MKPRITVFGSFNMDLVAYIQRRPKSGETLRGDTFAISLGGKGFNQAISAARSGAETSMLGNIGLDIFGDDFMNALEKEGVNSSEIECGSDMGTGVALPVVTRDGDNSIIIIAQANDLSGADYVSRHKQRIIDSDVLLLQLEVPMEGNLAAAKLAKESGVLVILTPAPVENLDEWKGLVDILVPNEGEAAHLTGIEEDFRRQAEVLMQYLKCKIVVISLGSRGAYVTDGHRSEIIAAPSVEAIDTIGAGDTMCANLATRFASGDDIFNAVKFGIFAGALMVTRRGSAMASPTPSEVKRFVDALPIK